MTLSELKRQVCEANLDLVHRGLVMMTLGNVSGIDRKRGVMVIKPSGLAREALIPAAMVPVRLSDGSVTGGGTLRPSSDTASHLALYRAFPEIGGVAHTHSRAATAFAQAQRPIPCLGTTHADHFLGDIPVTRMLTPEELDGHYEAATGAVMIAAFRCCDPLTCPAVLVAGHGPFTWGRNAAEAVDNSGVLETVADMASRTLALTPKAATLPTMLQRKHFFRKHGTEAYYGQT